MSEHDRASVSILIPVPVAEWRQITCRGSIDLLLLDRFGKQADLIISMGILTGFAPALIQQVPTKQAISSLLLSDHHQTLYSIRAF